jgi:hypothetical protein
MENDWRDEWEAFQSSQLLRDAGGRHKIKPICSEFAYKMRLEAGLQDNPQPGYKPLALGDRYVGPEPPGRGECMCGPEPVRNQRRRLR